MRLPEEVPQPRLGGGVGPGWFDIVRVAHAAVSSCDPNYTLDQVKEKFGTLSFYYTLSEGVDYAHVASIVDPIIACSSRTCEECGEPGTTKPSQRGWLRTLCDKHREEHDEAATS